MPDLAERVFVEPLGRAVLSGVPALGDDDGPRRASGDARNRVDADDGDEGDEGDDEDGKEPRGRDPKPEPPKPDPDDPPRRRPLDVCVLPVFADERPLTGLAGFFDWRASGMLSALVRQRLCTGRAGEAVLMPARTTLPATRIVLYGLGESSAFDHDTAREAAAAMVGVAQNLRPRDVMLAMPGRGQERAIVEAVFDAALATLNTSGGGSSVGVGETAQWWVIADPRHVARLRRVLDGPPRAAGGAQ